MHRVNRIQTGLRKSSEYWKNENKRSNPTSVNNIVPAMPLYFASLSFVQVWWMASDSNFQWTKHRLRLQKIFCSLKITYSHLVEKVKNSSFNFTINYAKIWMECTICIGTLSKTCPRHDGAQVWLINFIFRFLYFIFQSLYHQEK